MEDIESINEQKLEEKLKENQKIEEKKNKKIDNNESNIYVDQMGNVIITPAEETPQKIPDDIMESYKKEMKTDDYLDTNINLESMTKSEFNLLEIKKELTDIKQKEILSQYVVKPFDEMEEDKNEEKKQRKRKRKR